jgi:hypothetical protein
MFKEIFEYKKGAVNGKEWKIEGYFEKKGYNASVGIFPDENRLYVAIYGDDEDEPEFEVRDLKYDNKTPKKVFDEVMKLFK